MGSNDFNCKCTHLEYSLKVCLEKKVYATLRKSQNPKMWFKFFLKWMCMPTLDLNCNLSNIIYKMLSLEIILFIQVVVCPLLQVLRCELIKQWDCYFL